MYRPPVCWNRRIRSTLTAVALGAATVAFAPAPPESTAMLWQVLQLVRTRFVSASDTTDVFERAARGLVRELGDPYSELLTPKRVEEFAQSALGRYAGVGVEIVPVGDRVYVGEVYPDTPGRRAGLQRGDRVVAVGDTAADGRTADQVVQLIRGAPGSPVTLTIDRPGAGARAVTLERAVIHLPAVPYVLVRDGVAYVPLTGFPETAGAEVRAALGDARRAGARGVVLDLRGNPGGSVDQAVHVVGAFVEGGRPAVEIRERTGSTVLRTTGPAVAADLPLVVLQDGGSASAAEIVAGALQDYDRALVVGARSFGKGVAQSVFPVPGGYALKLTTARWFTPIGRSIQRDPPAADSSLWRGRGRGGAPLAPADAPTDMPSRTPTFRTPAGRTLAGGGGITPDVTLGADTLVGAERDVALRLAGAAEAAVPTITRVAHRLAEQLAPKRDTTFVLQPAWRAELRRALLDVGVMVPVSEWDAAGGYVGRLLERRVAELAFGPREVRRRDLARDPAFQVADSLVRGLRGPPARDARQAGQQTG